MCNLKTEIKENESKANGEMLLCQRQTKTNQDCKEQTLFPHGSKLNRIRIHKSASEPSVVKYNSQLLAKTAHSLQAEHKVVTALSFSDFLSLSLSASSLGSTDIMVS